MVNRQTIRRKIFHLVLTGVLLFSLGAVVLSPQPVSAAGEQALSFNGTTDYVDCGTDASLDITEAITIEAWIKITDNSGYQAIVGKRNGAAEMNYLVRLNDGYLKFTFYNGGYRDLQDDTTQLANNTFYYIAVTYDRANIRLYVNGAEVKSVGETDAMIPDTSPLTIGRQAYSNSSYFSGLIDEVRISNIARTPGDIDASWNGGLGQRFVMDDDTVALWHMDGTGGTLSDETGINDGTIYGATRVPGFQFEEEPPPISQIVFTTDPQTVVVNRASEAMTIQTQDESGDPVSVAADTTINLGFSQLSAEFSLSLDPWVPTPSLIIPAGNSEATFYFKSTVHWIGDGTIFASEDPDVSWDNATQGVTVQGPVQLWRGVDLIGTYFTIQEAIDAAVDGDDIVVLPGTYEEQVVIDKQITLKSQDGAATTIIDAQEGKAIAREPGEGISVYPAVWIQRDGVVFGGVDQGFTIRNTVPVVFPEGGEDPNEWGVAILALDPGCIIRGNTIEDSNPMGIFADVDTTIISQNIVSASIFGIFGGGGGGSITENIVSGSMYCGIAVESHQGNNNVSNNTVSNTGWYAIMVQLGDDNQIMDNELYDNQGTAIRLQHTSNAEVTGNYISSDATDAAGIYGIEVEGGNNNNISSNDISYVLVSGITLNNTSDNSLSGNEICDIYGYDLSDTYSGKAEWTREQQRFDRFSVKLETGEDPEGVARLEIPTSFPLEHFEMSGELGGGELYFWAYLPQDMTLLPTYQLELDIDGDGIADVTLEANTGREEGLMTNEWLKLSAMAWWTNVATSEEKDISAWIDDFPGAKVVKVSVVYSGTPNQTMYIDGSRQEGMPIEPPKGIAIGRSNRNSVSDNGIYGINGAGILIVESNQNMIGEYNFIVENWTGVVIENSNDNTVKGSLIADNYRGILIKHSYNNQIIGNDIMWNTGGMSGVHLDGESGGNEIHANNIVDNTPRDGEGNIIRDGDGNITSFGIVKDGGWVNATGNWWGDGSGPYHERENPEGMGDAVSDFVHFGPQANTPLPEFIAPTIVNNLAMPRMTAVLGMFMGDAGPEWTSFIVEAWDNEGGVGIAQVTVNLKSLLLQMLPGVVIPPEKQEQWDNWLNELERSHLGHQGNNFYQRHFRMRDEFMNQLRWYLGAEDIQQIMDKLTLGDFSIEVTVTDWCGNEVSTGWSPMTSPTSNMLFSVWGSSRSDVFAVGSGGTILHYNGSSWSPLTSGTINNLTSVWGSSGSDVFAVGYNGTILHYDGSSWSSLTSGTSEHLWGVWGSSGSDVFAVGKAGTILHYDGTTWSLMSTPALYNLNGVWGSSGSDVFAVGDAGRMFHYDGTTWSLMESGIGTFLASVWGSSGSDVFAVGGSGAIVHYDGTTWSPMTSGTTNWFNSVWGSSGSDVFAAGIDGTIFHYDGTTWSPLTSGTTRNFRGLWGSSGSDVFATGDLGTIVHYYSPVDLTIVDIMQPLKEGWNLISTPVTLEGEYATWEAILALGDGLLCDDAIRYDPTAGEFGEWVGLGENPLYELKPLEAIYVHATGNDQIGIIFNRGVTPPPSLYLEWGWNLVGLAIPPTDWDSMPVNEAMVSAEKGWEGYRGYNIVVSPYQQFDYSDRYRYRDTEGREYHFGEYGWNCEQNPWVYTVGADEIPEMSVGGGYWVFMQDYGILAGSSTTPVTIVHAPEEGHDLDPLVPRYDRERVTRTLFEEYRDGGYTKVYLTYSGDVSPSRVVEFYQQRMAEYGWELTEWEGSEDRASLDFTMELGAATFSCHIDVVGGESIDILFKIWEPGVDLPDVPRFEWGWVAMTAYSQTTDDVDTQTNISYEGELEPDRVGEFYERIMREYNWDYMDECQGSEFAWFIFRRHDEEGRTYICLIWAERGIIEIEHRQFAAFVPEEYIDVVISLWWDETIMRQWAFWEPPEEQEEPQPPE